LLAFDPFAVSFRPECELFYQQRKTPGNSPPLPTAAKRNALSPQQTFQLVSLDSPRRV
jgi:hypothetical protein